MHTRPFNRTQAIALAPEEASYYGNRAAAAMMILQYEQTIDDCDRAIGLTPDNAKLYFRKGKALASLVRVGLIRPIDCNRRVNPANTPSVDHNHHIQGKFAEARAAYNAGLAQDPNNATGVAEKAEVEQAAKATVRARELLEQHNGNGGVNITRAVQQADALVDMATALASQSLELKMLKVRPSLSIRQSVSNAFFSYAHSFFRTQHRATHAHRWSA